MRGGKVMWKTLTPPTRQDWLDMAMDCHAKGQDWPMWIGLLLWAAGDDDCNTLGVCQGHQPPCVDCPAPR
jgi:hypothetical protein